MWKLVSSSCARCEANITSVIRYKAQNTRTTCICICISVHAMCCGVCFQLWRLCCVAWDPSNTWLGHPIRMQLKSDFCCDRRGRWGHASATAALQRLGEASITQGWLQGPRGLSEPATWCIWNPPTHIPSTHSMTWARRDTNGEQGEHASLGDLILTRGDIWYAPVLPHTPSLLLLSHWVLKQAAWQSSSTASPNSPSTHLCSYSNWTLSGPLMALCRARRTTCLK